MKTLLRLLSNKAAWALIIALAGAAGIKLSPETQQAVIQLGPVIATEADQGTHE